MQFELKTRQICLFYIALMPITKLFLMPSITAEHASQDMWICSLFNCSLDFITIFSLLRLCKNAKTNVFGLIENLFGKVGAKIFFFAYALYFLTKAVIPLNEQKDFVAYSLYTLMPIMLYFLPFFLVAIYFSCKNLRVIGRASDVLWFVTITAFAILIPLSLSNVDIFAMLPVGASGLANITKGAYNSLTWFGDSAYMLFFVGEFSFRKGDGKKILFSYFLSVLILLIFLVIFYSVFTSIAFRQRFALTEISKYTSVINNVGRFDYLGIFMILFSNLFALSVPMFFSSKILNYLFNFSRKWISPLIVVGLEAFLMIVFYQRIAGIENFIMRYCGWLFLLFGNVLPIIITFIGKEKTYESAQS